MRYRWLSGVGGGLGLLAGLLLMPQAVTAATTPLANVPAAQLVSADRAALLQLGCSDITADPATQTIDIPADKPLHVTPRDWTINHYIFCPLSTQAALQAVTGQVAQAVDDPADPPGEDPGDNDGNDDYNGGYCAFILRPIAGFGCRVFSLVAKWILTIIAIVGIWVLRLVSGAIEFMLIQGGFTQHPFVRAGWPLVQGIANLGFILAILYVAVLTVLRLGEGWSRFLPKILIAALLLNFSLVIGGVIIDASRFIMAVEARWLQNTNINDLGIGLLLNTQFVSLFPEDDPDRNLPVFQYHPTAPIFVLRWQANVDDHNPRNVLKMAMATIAIWVFTIAFIYLIFGLFARYVALILLLIVSPLVYLAIAFPGMQGLARSWWHTFFRFVIYGPLVLFLLLLISGISSLSLPLPNNALINVLFQGGLTIALLYAGLKAIQSFGAFGADKFINASKNFAKRHPYLTAGGIGLATGGVGTALLGAGGILAGRTTATQAGDAWRTARDNYRGRAKDLLKKSKWTSWAAPGDRDKEGKLKPGETSVGSRLGGFVSPYKSEAAVKAKAALQIDPATKKRKMLVEKWEERMVPVIDKTTGREKKELVEAKDNLGNTIYEYDEGKGTTVPKMIEQTVMTKATVKVKQLHPDLKLENLRKPGVIDALDEKEIDLLFTDGGADIQKFLVKQKGAVRKMSGELKAKIQAGAFDKDKLNLSDMIVPTLRDVNRETEGK
jgi:hypothetical protein